MALDSELIVSQLNKGKLMDALDILRPETNGLKWYWQEVSAAKLYIMT